MQTQYRHRLKTQNTIRSFRYRDQLFSQSSKRPDQQSPLPNVSACTQQERPSHNRAERTSDVTRQQVCCSASVSGIDIDNMNCQQTYFVKQSPTTSRRITFHAGVLKHLRYSCQPFYCWCIGKVWFVMVIMVI